MRVKIANPYVLAVGGETDVRLFVQRMVMYPSSKTVGIQFMTGQHNFERIKTVFKDHNRSLLVAIEASTSSAVGTVELNAEQYDRAFKVAGNEFETFVSLTAALEAPSPRVQAFSETKRRVIEALDFRIEMLTTSAKTLSEAAAAGKYNDSSLGSQLNRAEDAGRLDELESFRSYVKGMVIKA